MKYVFTSRLHDISNLELTPYSVNRQYYGEDMISFADKWFAHDCYTTDGWMTAVNRAVPLGKLQQQLNTIEGDPELRLAIIDKLFQHPLSPIEVEQTLITIGRQHTLELIAQALLEPGDAVCTDTPVPAEVWQMIHKHGAQVKMISCDEHGIMLEELEVQLKKHRPKFIYTNPSNDRVTGRKWTKERMISLLQLCRSYNTLILEEDAYGELHSDSNRLLRFVELERETVDRIVVYMGCFGRGVFPGIQLGIVVADARVIDKLAQLKQISGTFSSMWEQVILKEMLNLSVDMIDKQLQRLIKLSQSCMDVIEEHLHYKKAWRALSGIRPQGGMYYKIALPNELSIQSVLACAVRKQVVFVPEIYMDQFLSKPTYRQYIRLSCTISDSDQIHRGMERLGEAIGEFMGRYSI